MEVLTNVFKLFAYLRDGNGGEVFHVGLTGCHCGQQKELNYVLKIGQSHFCHGFS